MSTIENLIGSASSDTLILLGVVAVLFIALRNLGLHVGVALTVGLYVAGLTYGASKDTQSALGLGEMLWVAVVLGIGLFVALTFNRYLAAEFSPFRIAGYFETLLFSVSFLGLLIALCVHVFPLAPYLHLGPLSLTLFGDPRFLILWLLAPTVVLFFLARR